MAPQALCAHAHREMSLVSTGLLSHPVSPPLSQPEFKPMSQTGMWHLVCTRHWGTLDKWYAGPGKGET